MHTECFGNLDLPMFLERNRRKGREGLGNPIQLILKTNALLGAPLSVRIGVHCQGLALRPSDVSFNVLNDFPDKPTVVGIGSDIDAIELIRFIANAEVESHESAPLEDNESRVCLHEFLERVCSLAVLGNLDYHLLAFLVSP